MKYTIEMDSCDMVYIPSFIKVGLGIQKLLWGIHTWTDRQTTGLSHKPTLVFFKIRKVG
jgi:hypothetical protein